MKRGNAHPYWIPTVLAACFIVGLGLAAWTGAPGVAGAALAFVPIAALVRALLKKNHVSAGKASTGEADSFEQERG